LRVQSSNSHGLSDTDMHRMCVSRACRAGWGGAPYRTPPPSTCSSARGARGVPCRCPRGSASLGHCRRARACMPVRAARSCRAARARTPGGRSATAGTQALCWGSRPSRRTRLISALGEWPAPPLKRCAGSWSSASRPHAVRRPSSGRAQACRAPTRDARPSSTTPSEPWGRASPTWHPRP